MQVASIKVRDTRHFLHSCATNAGLPLSLPSFISCVKRNTFRIKFIDWYFCPIAAFVV